MKINLNWRKILINLTIIFIFLLIISIINNGFAPTTIIIFEQDSGKQLTLLKGQYLAIFLNQNTSTGYSWDILEINNTMLEKIDSYGPFDPINNTKLGESGRQILRFKGLERGHTILKLKYISPWEKDNIEKIFEINITVKPSSIFEKIKIKIDEVESKNKLE